MEKIYEIKDIMYKGKKYKTHIGKKGGEYILVGAEKKKIYVTRKTEENHKIIPEAMAQKMLQVKEERDQRLFYEFAEVEPEEETLEQKIRRQKKELIENKIR